MLAKREPISQFVSRALAGRNTQRFEQVRHLKPARRTKLGVPEPLFEVELITGNAGDDELHIVVAACTASAWPAERAPLVRYSRCWLEAVKVSLCRVEWVL